MKKAGKLRIVSWILVGALTFSVCPDIVFEQDPDGNVSVGVESYGPETVQAAEVTLSQLGEDWEYTQNDTDQTVTLESYKGSGGAVTIPALVYGKENAAYKVCMKSFGATEQAKKVTSVVIEKGVKGVIPNSDYIEGYGDYYIGMFMGCSSMTSVDLSGLDVSDLKVYAFMFKNCISLTSVDLTTFEYIKKSTDDYGVYDYRSMFEGCSALTTIYANPALRLRLSVRHDDMFKGTEKIVPGGGTGVNVGTYNSPYYDSENFTLKELPEYTTILEDWKYEKVDGIYYLYDYIGTYAPAGTTRIVVPKELKNLAGDTVDFRFRGYNLEDLEGKSVSSPGRRGGIRWLRFEEGVKAAYNCSRAFVASGLMTIDVGGLDTSETTNMYEMFSECSGVDSLDLSNFNTKNVTNFAMMFYKDFGLKSLNLSSFDTTKGENLNSMFISGE